MVCEYVKSGTSLPTFRRDVFIIRVGKVTEASRMSYLDKVTYYSVKLHVIFLEFPELLELEVFDELHF
jgi:hypothetical protein